MLRRDLRENLTSFIITMRHNKILAVGIGITAVFIISAIIGSFIEPEATIGWEKRFQPPSLEHPLGTDYFGRDILKQLIIGSKDVLLIASLTALFAILIALTVGGFSGYIGRSLDTVLMGLTDIMLTLPSFPMMMIFAVVLKVRDPVTFSLILALWSWAGLARAIRSKILSLKNEEYIEAAYCLGLGRAEIIFTELMPNMMPYILIEFIRIMKNSILAAVGIMFLGMAPFTPYHWGVMLNIAIYQTGAILVPSAYHWIFSIIGAIVLLQLGLVSLANGLEEIFNPRLKKYE